ncbi:MAG TPA: polysaccharide lyase family 8 super-sandwich domain-containing protein, partial [Tepidisphaeraceae bacterium]|nr:polysaccharide lyase family 8 super-sandwich domain-containing protein [Tepidisphaeraceae bacterium]
MPRSCAIADTACQSIVIRLREFCLNERIAQGLPPNGGNGISQATAMRLVGRLSADGSWPDINYASGDPSVWPPSSHLGRILNLLVLARQPQTSPAMAGRCIAAAHRALAYWMIHDYRCPNWWFNQIGVPQLLGNIALVMGNDLTPAERNYILNVAMPRSHVGAMTGENRIWLAGNGLIRAALLDDPALVAKAAAVIQSEYRVTTAEGIQPDWSFHQHGPQQQFGNYGLSCAADLSRWALILRGTPYAISPDRLAILRNYLLRGQAWITWRGTMDIGSCGRQLAPDSPRAKAAAMEDIFRTMEVADPAHAAEYAAYVARNADSAPNDLVGTVVFWRSDYAIDRQREWMAAVKMHSARVIGGESLNGENLSGVQLADGATFLYLTGHEYDDIFPVWDWRKIPGTTELQTGTRPTWTKKTDQNRSTIFVGGASDGENACCAMDFQRDGVKAHKAWFMHGNVLICLGSAISSSSPDPVVTTLNQCILNGPIVIDGSAGQKTVSQISARLSDVDSITHDGFRYTFPYPQPLLIEAGPRTGNWKVVYNTASTPKADVTKNVFTLCIDHGRHPDSAAYAYFVSPAEIPPPVVKILSNTADLQSVQIGDWTAAVFWSPGTADLNGASIAVDHACVVLMNLTANGSRITAADPTERLAALDISVNGRFHRLQLPLDG